MLRIAKIDSGEKTFFIVYFSGKVDLSQIEKMSNFIADNSKSGNVYMIAIDEGFSFGFKKLSDALTMGSSFLNSGLVCVFNETTDGFKKFVSLMARHVAKFPMYPFQEREELWKLIDKVVGESYSHHLETTVSDTTILLVIE